MPSAEIFAYHVNAGFTNGSPNPQTTYTNEGSTSIGDWNDAAVPIHLGTFAIDFILDNKQIADNNYNYYKFGDTGGGVYGWSAESGFAAVSGSSKAASDEMVTVCFYKNAEPTECNSATYKQEVTVAFPTLTSTTATDTTTPVTIALRKILGVSSQCGAGDTGYDLDGGAKDIFVWSDLSATNSVDYTITINLEDEYGNGLDPGAGGLTSVTEGAVAYSITVNNDHKVHDLLFIEGELASSAAKTAGTFDSPSEEELEFNYFVGYDATGQFSRDAKTVAVQCESTLTVDAQGNTDSTIPNRDSHWHCYRGTDNKLFPLSGASSDEVDNAGSLDTLNTKAPTDRHSACTAKLVVECTGLGGDLDITGSDTRACSEGNATYTEEMDGQTGAEGEEDCLTTQFWLRKYDYAAYDPIEVTYEAAIVQAVRLRKARLYPKDVSNKADGDSVKTLFPSVQTTNWECANADCSTEDPYKVLYAAEATTKVECGTVETQGTSGVNTITGLDANANTWTQTCTATNPGLNSGATAILPPPANFPESYVFAAVSYSYTTRTQTVGITQETPTASEPNVAGTVSDTAVNSFGGIDAATVDAVDESDDNARRLNAVHETRLRALKTKKPTHGFFQVIQATQHVIQ